MPFGCFESAKLVSEAEVDAVLDSILDGTIVWGGELPKSRSAEDYEYINNVPLGIEGLVPGSGKSYSIKDHFRRHRRISSLLTVTPWNRLRCEMSKDGFAAITLHKLVGRLVAETADADSRKAPYDLTGITHVHFEEPYLYTVAELEWIREFMRAHSTLGFTFAGDPGQLRPVGQKLNVDHDEYYERIFASLFPHRLVLQYSKRCSSPEEGRRMEALCEDLRNELDPVPAILSRHGIREVNFEELTAEDAQYKSHIAATRSTVADVNKWAHLAQCDSRGEQPDAYLRGQELLGRGGGKVRGGRINPNEVYTVVDCDSQLRVTNCDGKPFELSLTQASKFLQRPYCATNHAFQGLSLGSRIYIHDYNHFMADHRWMRTAVSRCGTLDIVLVRHQAAGTAAGTLPAAAIGARIQAHRGADSLRGFAYAEAEYVSGDWVACQLAEQSHMCAECLGDLGEVNTGLWSIDRLDNYQPHIRGNCRLVCHVRAGTCQQKSGGRRPAARIATC
jgi:hypothetical protein